MTCEKLIRTFNRLVLSLVLLSFASCTLEQKLAQTFVDNGIKEDFLLMEPGYVFKYNLKTYEIPGLDTMNEYLKDSVLVSRSLFLKDVSDSLFLFSFTSGFQNQMKAYGISIYPENYLDTFMASGRKALVINLAQFSLEEYVHPYSSDEAVDEEIVTIDDIDLNALNYNIWLELSLMNAEGSRKVFFASDFLMDNLEGVLMQYLFSGDMRYDYTIDTISMSQVYGFASKFGKEVAGYLYDYFLNTYIGNELPPGYQFERYYYHYDPEKRRIYPVDPAESLMELAR